VTGSRSVVEGVPADGASALLIVENEFTDSRRQVHPLPPPFLHPSPGGVFGWDACAGRPDGVRRSTQVMGGDVSDRNRLARRQRSELGWIGHPAGRRVRLECLLECLTHAHLTADPGSTDVDPGSTDVDSLAGPAVTWLMILEQMQHVLNAQEGPVSQQAVVFVRQTSPATNGDQPRITLFRQDRHPAIPITHEATSQRAPRADARAWPVEGQADAGFLTTYWLRLMCSSAACIARFR